MESKLKGLSFQALSRREKILVLAGVFDGEGSYGMWMKNSKARAPKRYFTIAVEASDADMVSRFAEVFGGSFYVIKKKQAHHKHCFRWKVNGDRAFEVMETMIPYMCQRRQDKYYGIVKSIRASSESGSSCISEPSKDQNVDGGRSDASCREDGERTGGVPGQTPRS